MMSSFIAAGRASLKGLSFPLAWTMLLVVAGAVMAQDTKAKPGAAPPDWPQFLGPDRNGISREKGLMAAWPKEGPREVWRVAGGVGMSGLAVRGGRLYTLVQKNG